MKRNGSALLIVLGVLSFLVVSAVAFSAYMRRARLPSSYLRRTVASRELAKAALARAVDEIDQAIADGVHPGVGGRSQNTWRDRVFFRGGGEQDISQTAPTLTFEGLAYLPPSLVNEVRYWSRKTPTAVWRSFGYDTGRFAYCAIDVSDFFDVNRLVADYPRSSAANRRITAAHLFEPAGHRSAPSGAYPSSAPSTPTMPPTTAAPSGWGWRSTLSCAASMRTTAMPKSGWARSWPRDCTPPLPPTSSPASRISS